MRRRADPFTPSRKGQVTSKPIFRRIMQTPRRDLLKLAGGGMAATLLSARALHAADTSPVSGVNAVGSLYPVRRFGAVGDGTTIDTPAVNKAIDAAAAAGGGVVHFSAG